MTSHDRTLAEMIANLSKTVDFWMSNGLSAADAVARALRGGVAGPRTRKVLAEKYGI